MDRKNKSALIAQLKETGYKQIPGMRDYYINHTGQVTNIKTGNPLKWIAGRDLIRIENKTYNVPKLILLAFRGEPYRKQKQIAYIDGNKYNISLQNIRYAALCVDLPDTVINETDFVNAIRCYIQVRKRYNRMDNIATMLYLQMITEKRCFFDQYAKAPYINVFQAYLSGFRMSIATTAKEKRIPIKECGIIVRFYINQLIRDIQKDVEIGILAVLPYQPRKKTMTQVLKEYNADRIADGLPPLKIDRRPAIIRYREKWENIKREIENESTE